MAEVTFSDFAKLAKRRGHNPESLAELFRGKIEDPREFFERVLGGSETVCIIRAFNTGAVPLHFPD